MDIVDLILRAVIGFGFGALCFWLCERVLRVRGPADEDETGGHADLEDERKDDMRPAA